MGKKHLGVVAAVVLALLLCVLGSGKGQAQQAKKRGEKTDVGNKEVKSGVKIIEEKKASDAAPFDIVHEVYAVRGASPQALASALQRQFKAEQSFVATPGAGNTILLLSGPKFVVNNAVMMLKAMDRPRQSIRVEVLVVQFGGKAGDMAQEIDGINLSGTQADVARKIRDLRQRGTITNVKRLEVTLLERESAMTQLGENKPFVTGLTTSGGKGGFGGKGGDFGGGPGGATTRSLAYRNIGTLLKVTNPEISTDGAIELGLVLEDTHVHPEGGGAGIGADDKAALAAPGFVTAHLELRLRVRPGHVAVAESTKSATKEAQAQRMILVSASAE
jgi:hypothetical protein